MCASVNEYFDNSKYIERCCLQPGSYTLVCENNVLIRRNDREVEYVGWYGSFIEIQGQKYCDDFVGHKAMRRVEVRGIIGE